MKKLEKNSRKKDGILHRRRIFVTVLLIVLAGMGTVAAFVLTERAKADINSDPFFTLSTGPAKVRIFQPLEKSVANPSTFTASGTAPPFSTVTVRVDGVNKGTATANDRGIWSRSVSDVSDGDHTLTAEAVLAGPFSVVGATQLIPGYSIVDLSTNGFVSSSLTGLGALLYSFTSGSSDNLTDNAVVKVSEGVVYLVRQRSLTVVDVAAQKGVKTITLSDIFKDEGGNDSGESLKGYVFSNDKTRLYLLFGSGYNGGPSKVVAIDTMNNTVVTEGGFPIDTITYAKNIVIANNDELFISAENSDQVGVVNTQTGTSDVITTPTSVLDMAISPDKNTIFLSRNYDDGTLYVSKLDPATKTLDATAINLGGALDGRRLYTPSRGSKLYVGSYNSNEIRVFDGVSGSQTGTIELNDMQWENKGLITENATGSRVYIGSSNGDVAVIDHDTDSLVGRVNKPAENYSGPNSLMIHQNKLFISYNRSPDLAGDLFDPSGNPSKLYASLAVANANTTSTVSAAPITVNGASSGMISQPITVAPITLTGTTNFSVGEAISITGPSGDALDTATPTITGKGPKNSQIKLSVNGGSLLTVSVNNNGDWSQQVTLPKNRVNTVSAVYENKRTQFIIPNTFIFGADIAKNQLSVIDGSTGLQQQPLNLPPIGVSNIKLNTSATMSPSGNRYYLVNTDATEFVTANLQLAISGNTEEAIGALPGLLEANLGFIDVYSAQTKQLTSRITLPKGRVPISMAISPDGRRGIISSFDIGKQLSILQNQEDLQNVEESPLVLNRVNLETNELIEDDIIFPFNISAIAYGIDPENGPQTITNIVSGGLNLLAKPAVFSANSNTFYTVPIDGSGIRAIDFATGQESLINIPMTTDIRAITGMHLNTQSNSLYLTYFEGNLPEGSFPTFSTGFMILNLTNNQIVGKVPLPGISLFNFAVSSNGARVYMAVIELADLINFVSSTIENPQGVLFDTLPPFKLAIYDLAQGQYTSRVISQTEIPYNLVLSPDESKVFIPTLLQNIVHVYDVPTDTMNGGNAPIILDGLSTNLGTVHNVGTVTLGAYSDSASYFVPPDAPDPPKPPENKNTVTERTTGVTQFRFIPAANSAGVQLTPEQLKVPEQAVQVVRQSAQSALNKPESVKKDVAARSWLVYFIYGAFMTILGLTGYTVWKTDMLLGKDNYNDYV